MDRAGFDPSVRVQDDLFRAVNGGWLRSTQIGPDKAAIYGVDLPDVVDQRVRAIVESMARGPQQAGSVAQKVGAFYSSYLDTAAIDRAGLAPIAPLLAEIDKIANARDLALWQGRAQGRVKTPINLWIMPSFADPGINRPMTWQGGLGLPDREYYLAKDEPRMAAAVAAYRVYLETLARLSGEADHVDVAKRVLAFEARIAGAQWSAADIRDPAKYKLMTPVELANGAPGFDWAAFLDGAGLGRIDRLTVAPGSSAAMAALFADVPLADWKLYLKMRALDQDAPVLPEAFRAARFAFRGTALNGQQVAAPRWQKAIEELNGAMGEAVGQLYVQRHFPAKQKARVQGMVDQLLLAARDTMRENTWMAPATKAQALEKLAAYTSKVAYPDQWRSYGALEIRAGDALGNSHRAARFAWSLEAAKAGASPDRGAWMMTPQTVNAYYDPMLNEIVLPAGHLQAPYFDEHADDAANYGALGVLIGHEISHGFDQQGSQFDAKGVLRNWWTEDDRTAFEAQAAKLTAQFARYEAIPGKHVDGKLTLAENMADLSGLQLAYRAYLRSLDGKAAPVIDGHSGAQRFFLSYARSLRAKMRDEMALRQLSADPHAPHEFRTNGAVVNNDAFHAAFATRSGDRLFKPANERIQLW